MAAVALSALAIIVSVGLACRRRANRKLAILGKADLSASITSLPETLEAPEAVCENTKTVSRSDLLRTKRSEYEATTTTTCSMTSQQHWQESMSTRARSKKGQRRGVPNYDPYEDPPKKKKSKPVNDKAYLHEERPATEGRDTSSSATTHDYVPPQDKSTNSSKLDMNLKCSNKEPPPYELKPSKEKLQLSTKSTNVLEEFERENIQAHLTTPQSDKSSLITPNQDDDFITNDEFEYDDFIPEVAGSYFATDTPGYTLTWSNRQN